MVARPYWSGQIRLSLVSLPVNLYSALNRGRQINLHEIYRPTGERVRHQKVADGEAIEREDIIKGYEYEKGEYVLIEPEEIEDLKIPSKKTLEIVQFVSVDEIDPIYFETPYFVVPDGEAAEDAFIIIREALRQTHKAGLGQLAIAGRERLCSLKPCGSGMLLEVLRYENEIRNSDPYFSEIGDIIIDKDQIDLAKELIKRKTKAFDPEKFHDHYREALQELIDAKLENREPRAVAEEKPKGKVVNLMDALRQSLKMPDKAGTKAPAKPKRSAKSRQKTKARPASAKPRRRAS